MASQSARARLDLRFVIGVALVVASVAGVWLVVSAARATTAVAAASEAILPGQRVDATHVHPVDVALGASAQEYLTVAEVEAGATAVRGVGAGELVPRAALAVGTAADTTVVVVQSAVAVPAAVGPGTAVEVWITPIDEDRKAQQPRILVAEATVASTPSSGSSMVRGAATTLELVVPRSAVAAVLEATAADALLSVVPIGGR